MLEALQRYNPFGTTSPHTQNEKASRKNSTCEQIVYQRVLSMTQSARTCAQKGLDAARVRVSSMFRDTFFYPMFGSTKLYSDRAKRESDRWDMYWDPKQPPSNLYFGQKSVRENFTPKQEEMPLQVDEQQLQLSYMLIQPKAIIPSSPFYTFGIMLGNDRTIKNVSDVHPFIHAYLKKKKKTEGVPQAQFIVLSLYNLNHKPQTVAESGRFTYEIVKGLTEKYGRFDLFVANSVSSITFAHSLSHFDNNLSAHPRHVCYNRGPSNLDQSNTHLHWPISTPLAKCTGWGFDPAHEVATRAPAYKEEGISIAINGVEKDRYFNRAGSLALNEDIQTQQKKGNLSIAYFNPEERDFEETSHHSLSAQFLDSYDLDKEKSTPDLVKPGQNLSQALIEQSLESMEKKEGKKQT
jgi:hypothetical protein